MRKLIFLDSRDIIDCIEHADPCDHLTLSRLLRDRDACLVYTASNVLETMPRERPLEEALELARRLELLPHVFVRHSEISALEFQQALAIFPERRSPATLALPFHLTFWRLLPHPADDRDAMTATLNRSFDRMPMTEQLRLILLGDAWVNHGAEYADELASVLDVHRRALGVSPPNKALFRYSVVTQLKHLSLNVSSPVRFADWLFRLPLVCAAWRLGHEAFQEMRRDQTVAMTRSDLQDFSHVYLLPYVSAATLDAQWREYCRRTGERLRKIGIELPYLENLHADTSEVLQALDA